MKSNKKLNLSPEKYINEYFIMNSNFFFIYHDKHKKMFIEIDYNSFKNDINDFIVYTDKFSNIKLNINEKIERNDENSIKLTKKLDIDEITFVKKANAKDIEDVHNKMNIYFE